MLKLRNQHTAACGDPPIVDGVTGNQYIGYCENTYGEQWIFTLDRETGKAVLRGGDVGWNNEMTTNLLGLLILCVLADAPPVFMLVAHDDNANPIEAAMLYLEDKKRDLSAELHICAKGGHGFGMRKDGKPINDWPSAAPNG